MHVDKVFWSIQHGNVLVLDSKQLVWVIEFRPSKMCTLHGY